MRPAEVVADAVSITESKVPFAFICVHLRTTIFLLQRSTETGTT